MSFQLLERAWAYVKYAVLLRIREPENRTPIGRIDLVYKSRFLSAQSPRTRHTATLQSCVSSRAHPEDASSPSVYAFPAPGYQQDARATCDTEFYSQHSRDDKRYFSSALTKPSRQSRVCDSTHMKMGCIVSTTSTQGEQDLHMGNRGSCTSILGVSTSFPHLHPICHDSSRSKSLPLRPICCQPSWPTCPESRHLAEVV